MSEVNFNEMHETERAPELKLNETFEAGEKKLLNDNAVPVVNTSND